MSKYYLALTIDTDPDELNTGTPDRSKLGWDGLHFAIQTFKDSLGDYPLTWYVRADGQLEHAYGSVRYLLDEQADFWQETVDRGDELGWHPHLYTIPGANSQPEIITDSEQAVHELSRIWEQIKDAPFDFKSFRMGEGWHTADTLNLVEKLGFSIDSTAIPGRDDSAGGHPRNWRDTPDHPYYPDRHTPRLKGQKRDLLEMPMSSWYFQTSYDTAPKLRYMNPCIHTNLWEQAIDRWQYSLDKSNNTVLVMIFHPIEAMAQDKTDLLYAYSIDSVIENLQKMEKVIRDAGHDVERVTVSQAAKFWKMPH